MAKTQTTKKSLLPAGSSSVQHQIATLGTLEGYALEFSYLWQAEDCPRMFLSFLAKQYGDSYIPATATETQIRAIIKNSFKTHQISGTKESIIAALAPFGKITDIKEWFNNGAAPATFSLTLALTNKSTSKQDIKDIYKIINQVKPCAKHLSDLKISLATSGNIHTSANVRANKRTLIRPFHPAQITTTTNLKTAAAFVSNPLRLYCHPKTK